MNAAQRRDCVLSSVVEQYVQTGEPVGSKTVSSLLNDICSSATVRNDMSELIERGYLLQPHTSAGRVPSANGFRYYIDHLMGDYLLPEQSKRRINGILPKFQGDTDSFVVETAKAIAKITGRTAMITTPVDENATLKRLEILQMGQSSVLIAILTSAGIMKSKLCQLDFTISPKELALFTQILNERFGDLKLSHITPAMAQTLAVSFGAKALQYAPLLQLVFDAAMESVRVTLHLEGQANLLLYSEFAPASVIELFARRESLLPHLNRAVDSAVVLGQELGDVALSSASLVISTYRLSGGLKGKLAVLGPLKTDYFRMIPTVNYIARATEESFRIYA